MNSLSVSKKVYADVSERVSTSLSGFPASASEAMRIVDAYLNGMPAESDDPMAMLAFNMIRAELDRAMVRSSRARERAKLRKAEALLKTIETMLECGDESEVEEEPLRPMLTRRERRAMARSATGKKRKWRKLQD